ncbi:MAG: hypothetical protein ACHQET_13700 [Chitinophagales bacterium]
MTIIVGDQPHPIILISLLLPFFVIAQMQADLWFSAIYYTRIITGVVTTC